MNITGAGCDTEEGSSLQQGLDDAKNHAGPDTVRLGSAPITTATGFSYIAPDPVAIIGAGGRDFGQRRSSLSDSSASPNSHIVLKVISAQPSAISGIGVVVPAGTSNEGIDTNAAVSDVAVEAASPTSNSPTAISLESGGALVDSDLDMPTSGSSALGVFLVGTNTRVEGSTIRAAHGLLTTTGAAGPNSGVVRRSEIVSSITGLEVDAGDFLVEDSLLRNTTDSPGSHNGVHLGALVLDTTLTVNHVTMIGNSGAGTAVTVQTNSAQSAGLTVQDSVLRGFGSPLSRSASGAGSANIAIAYSDYQGAPSSDSGPGSITATNQIAADPGFVGASDFRLRPDSPLIDAGDPAALASGDSATDLSGQPRVTDGNGDCSARRDVGAYEFQPGPRAPRASATATPTSVTAGQPVAFDAAGSCDPDGEELTFAWSFDDGGAASGASAQHAFAAAGAHAGTVTVTDSTGRATTATAYVLVIPPKAPPPIPRYAGVKIRKQTVKISKRGVATVKVGCPASASGACAGTLELAHKYGRKRFSIPRAKTGKVSVKLTRRALKLVRKHHRLTVKATAPSHDASGLTKVATGTLVLRTR